VINPGTSWYSYFHISVTGHLPKPEPLHGIPAKILNMEDLTVDLVMAIHTRIVTDNGFDSRILSEACLHQLVFQANLFPEIMPRAAFIFYSLCAFPAFREGNRETAHMVAQEILASCGFHIYGETAEIMALSDGIREYRTEPEDVEAWFGSNVRKNGNSP